MSLRSLAFFLVAVATTFAASAPTEPPQFEHSFQGASFTVSVKGTWPTTYQWYRGTPEKKEAIPAPEGIQPTLHNKLTDPAGIRFCEVTNAAGTSVSKTFRLSFTRVADAADFTVVIKVP